MIITSRSWDKLITNNENIQYLGYLPGVILGQQMSLLHDFCEWPLL